jgi:Ca2+-binding RTX toxin-like protein
LTGGTGDDQFVFSSASTTMVFKQGDDSVANFHAGAGTSHDTIEISKSLAADYSHLQIEQAGQNTLVHINATDSILLTHVTATQVTHDNFLFV